MLVRSRNVLGALLSVQLHLRRAKLWIRAQLWDLSQHEVSWGQLGTEFRSTFCIWIQVLMLTQLNESKTSFKEQDTSLSRLWAQQKCSTGNCTARSRQVWKFLWGGCSGVDPDHPRFLFSVNLRDFLCSAPAGALAPRQPTWLLNQEQDT